jgi:hypothetical protein
MYIRQSQSRTSTGATWMIARSLIAKPHQPRNGKTRPTSNARSTALCAKSGKERTSSKTYSSRGYLPTHASNQPASPVSRKVPNTETIKELKKKN